MKEYNFEWSNFLDDKDGNTYFDGFSWAADEQENPEEFAQGM